MCFEREYEILQGIIAGVALALMVSMGFVAYALVEKVRALEAGQVVQEVEHSNTGVTVIICTVLVCVTVTVIFALWNWHKRKIAETNLAILQTPVEKL